MTPDELIAELDSLFGSAPQKKVSPVPEQKFWIPFEVVLAQHAWQCKCGASEPGTPSLFVRERMGRATRLRRCGRNNYPQLPRKLEILEPEIIDTCPYCFSTDTVDPQLRFPFEEELAPFIKAVKKTFSELHEERVEEVQKLGLAIASNQPELLSSPDEPFLVEFTTGSRHSIYYSSSEGLQHLEDETTAQAVDLAQRGLIDIL